LRLAASISFNAGTASPSSHFLVSRKKLSDIAQTHLISASLKTTEKLFVCYTKKVKEAQTN
jgi:hypothetical protein